MVDKNCFLDILNLLFNFFYIMKATIQKVTPMNNQWGIIAKDETGGQIHTITDLALKVGQIVEVKYRNGRFILV